MKVLIVEDDEATRLALRHGVARLGHEVVAVEDGQAAWDYLLVDEVDVVISDWLMPRLDGLELCRRLRAAADRPYTYVILQSVRRDREDTLLGMQAGADDYLPKPCTPDDLEARLIAAERVASLHGRLRETMSLLTGVASAALVEQERAQVQGVALASRTIQHEVNNHLALATGYAECLVADPSLPEHLRDMADLSVQGIMDAAAALARLTRVTKIRQQDWGACLPTTLDLVASSN